MNSIPSLQVQEGGTTAAARHADWAEAKPSTAASESVRLGDALCIVML